MALELKRIAPNEPIHYGWFSHSNMPSIVPWENVISYYSLHCPAVDERLHWEEPYILLDNVMGYALLANTLYYRHKEPQLYRTYVSFYMGLAQISYRLLEHLGERTSDKDPLPEDVVMNYKHVSDTIRYC